MIFDTQEDMDEAYYQEYPMMTDDPDEENARIDRWANQNGHEVDDSPRQINNDKSQS